MHGHAVDKVPWIGTYPAEIVMRHCLVVVARIEIDAVGRLQGPVINICDPKTAAGTAARRPGRRSDCRRNAKIGGVSRLPESRSGNRCKA